MIFKRINAHILVRPLILMLFLSLCTGSFAGECSSLLKLVREVAQEKKAGIISDYRDAVGVSALHTMLLPVFRNPSFDKAIRQGMKHLGFTSVEDQQTLLVNFDELSQTERRLMCGDIYDQIDQLFFKDPDSRKYQKEKLAELNKYYYLNSEGERPSTSKKPTDRIKEKVSTPPISIEEYSAMAEAFHRDREKVITEFDRMISSATLKTLARYLGFSPTHKKLFGLGKTSVSEAYRNLHRELAATRGDEDTVVPRSKTELVVPMGLEEGVRDSPEAREASKDLSTLAPLIKAGVILDAIQKEMKARKIANSPEEYSAQLELWRTGTENRLGPAVENITYKILGLMEYGDAIKFNNLRRRRYVAQLLNIEMKEYRMLARWIRDSGKEGVANAVTLLLLDRHQDLPHRLTQKFPDIDREIRTAEETVPKSPSAFVNLKGWVKPKGVDPSFGGIMRELKWGHPWDRRSIARDLSSAIDPYKNRAVHDPVGVRLETGLSKSQFDTLVRLIKKETSQ